jgi:hypothetical protein
LALWVNEKNVYELNINKACPIAQLVHHSSFAVASCARDLSAIAFTHPAIDSSADLCDLAEILPFARTPALFATRIEAASLTDSASLTLGANDTAIIVAATAFRVTEIATVQIAYDQALMAILIGTYFFCHSGLLFVFSKD